MGKATARSGGLVWRAPAAADIKVGDSLQYYDATCQFRFRVLSLQHGGEWVFGMPEGEEGAPRGGPIAVKRSSCMTPETAERVLHELPTLPVDPPLPG